MDALCVAGLCIVVGLLTLLVLVPSRSARSQPTTLPLDDSDWDDAEDERAPVYYHRAWMEQQRGGDDAGPPG